MTVETAAESLRARVPWQVGQKLLASMGLPRGQGWAKTVKRLSEDDPSIAAQADEINQALIDHYLSGEKLARMYELEGSELHALHDSVINAEIPSSIFSEHYPALVPKGELPSVLGTPTLVAVHQNDDGVAAIFASVRVLVVREELDRSTLPDGVAAVLEDFDELVGLRHVKWQAMDVLWVPRHGNLIDLRVDFPAGMHQTTGDVALEQLKDAVTRATGFVVSAAPKNLFPLIDRIYKADGEGLIVELAFGTSTASLKHERMRRKKNCLRQEVYHVGGKNALASEIEIHRLSVVWKRALGDERYSYPELTLNANSRSAGAVVPLLTSATIRDCMGREDYEFVRGKLIEYASSE